MPTPPQLSPFSVRTVLYMKYVKRHDYSELSLAYRPSHADATYDFKCGVRSVHAGMMNSGFLDFAVNIPKLEHFEGVGFRRWQKKMKFLLAALNVAYVLSTPKPVEQEDETLEATRRRLKWKMMISPAVATS
nr:uncharacterized protein LOC109192662 [Ipomoea trifida]